MLSNSLSNIRARASRISLEEWLLPAFGVLLGISFLASVLILTVGIPLGLSGDEASARGELSQAISTIFALALGLIAILVALRVESASFKATQEVRNWLSQLVATLLTALRISSEYLGTGGSRTHDAPPDYKQLQENITSINFDKISLAMSSWIASIQPRIGEGSRPKEWRTFFLSLVELQSAKSAEGVSLRCVDLLRLLATLDARDIRVIAAQVHNLDRTLGTLPALLEGDIIIKAATQSFARDKSLNLNELFRYIKATGVDDPTLDLFIAVTSETEDVHAVKMALEAGADVRATDTQLIAKYRTIVDEYRTTITD